ncbi:MAG: outer membrane lipoprotein carrier protein LolA [Pseudomonadota bacterium]
MQRRDMILGASALGLLGALGARAQDQRTLDAVSTYLNQLRSIEARFVQVASTGGRISGKLYMMRPGFIRFEYDGTDDMVLSDGINIGVFDSKSDRTVTKYPLRTTPLRHLLGDKIDLAGSGAATGTTNDGTLTQVILKDPKKPREGSLTLVFTNRPPALDRWKVLDAQGKQTTVVLQDLKKTSGYRRRFFNIEYEVSKRT